MKRLVFLILLGSLLLAACTNAPLPSADVPTLIITDGTASKTYTSADLQNLGQAQVEDKGITYIGVPLIALLQNSGYDINTIISVQAIASDDFTAKYDQTHIHKQDTLLAYARSDGPLSADDGVFRMVLPNQPGKLNPRMVVKLFVNHP